MKKPGEKVNEESLKRSYDKRVDKYLEKNNINSKTDLTNLITRGSDFYSSLDGQDEIIEALKDPKFVEENIVNKIDPEILKMIDEREKVNNIKNNENKDSNNESKKNENDINHGIEEVQDVVSDRIESDVDKDKQTFINTEEKDNNKDEKNEKDNDGLTQADD